MLPPIINNNRLAIVPLAKEVKVVLLVPRNLHLDFFLTLRGHYAIAQLFEFFNF